jgi:hypothetical protein
MSTATLINCFEVAPEEDERFLQLWRQADNLLLSGGRLPDHAPAQGARTSGPVPLRQRRRARFGGGLAIRRQQP